jgi:hypothetical protein
MNDPDADDLAGIERPAVSAVALTSRSSTKRICASYFRMAAPAICCACRCTTRPAREERTRIDARTRALPQRSQFVTVAVGTEVRTARVAGKDGKSYPAHKPKGDARDRAAPGASYGRSNNIVTM